MSRQGTPHPQAMPDEYKVEYCDDADLTNTVLAYRKYYFNDKKDIAKWNKTRAMPDWYVNGTYRTGYDYHNMREEWVDLLATIDEPDYVNRAD
jgi:hypothetical protein